MRMMRRAGALGVLVLIGAGLEWALGWALLATATPAAAAEAVMTALRHPQAAVDARGADALALTLVGAACWLVLLWLAVALALVAAAALPGWLGRAADVAAEVAVPAALRRLLALALGVGLASGVGGTAALADAAAAPLAPPAISGLDLDWPLTAPPARNAPAPGASAAPVVVHHGDTLWEIAGRQLGAGATPEQIAAAWPRWFAANRQVIGPDPGLILPGERLTPPPAA